MTPTKPGGGDFQGWKTTRTPKPGGGNKVTFTKFECDICHKLFSGKSGLYYHMVTHTGKYKFTCQMCGRGFMQSLLYNKHLESHRKRLGTSFN